MPAIVASVGRCRGQMHSNQHCEPQWRGKFYAFSLSAKAAMISEGHCMQHLLNKKVFVFLKNTVKIFAIVVVLNDLKTSTHEKDLSPAQAQFRTVLRYF